MSTYFVILKDQMADFFRALDSAIIFERSSNVITETQSRIYSAVFSNSPMSFLGMLFADSMTLNTPIEFSELPRTMRMSFESQMAHGRKNAFISIKEVFLMKTLWLVRKHHNNFWWRNFMFAITDSIFEHLILCWPSQAAKFLIFVEYFFIFELEVIAVPFAASSQGVSNDFEVLQMSEALIVIYHIYLEKYCLYLKTEMEKSISKRDQHIYSIFKMYAQKTDTFFSFLFKAVHSKQFFFFKSLKLVVHQYLQPLDFWSMHPEFFRLYLEVNYPTIKKVQEEFVKIMLNCDYEDAQDLVAIEQTARFFEMIRRYEEEKNIKTAHLHPILDSNKVIDIYKKLVPMVSGQDITRSLKEVAIRLGFTNTAQLESEIEREVSSRNERLRERQARPSGTMRQQSRELNWNSPFNYYAESAWFFWIFYYISLLIDKVFGRKAETAHPSSSGTFLLRNGQLVPYKNSMLIGRKVPVTNLRAWASKSVRNFMIGALIAFCIMNFILL